MSCRRLVLPLMLFFAVSTPRLIAQTIRGVVLDGASRQPIPGAVVTLLGGSGKSAVRSITGTSGTFAFALSGTATLRGRALGASEVGIARGDRRAPDASSDDDESLIQA